ncbi:hypothetical protein G6F23_008338 [Rhizopus arrhizus]|nr:hypothetical protein G6F23_008338 [Rhizopus arrhizus]
MFGYELDKLLYNYDYGIVPGSATIFVRDEVQKTVKMDLTLLENIMVIIEITNEGYKVLSCSPLSNTVQMSSLQLVQQHMETLFDSMENLLIKISPLFKDKFQKMLDDNLNGIHKAADLLLLEDFDQWIH